MNNTCRECEKQKFVLPYEYFANPLTIVEEGGDWIQSAIKHPGRCTPGSPNYDCPKGSPQWNLAQRFKHGDLHKGASGGEMIKRADGSYSRRGLWDNIRANKGSGKAPTKEMLEQERKIKSKQLGGDAQNQIIQVIKMYAKKRNVDPQVIVQELQQLDETQQEQALQMMVAEIQQSGVSQQSAPMSYANNDEVAAMESFARGGASNYPVVGSRGFQGVAGGVGEGVPYIAPAVHTAIGDSKFFGPLKAVTGYMGLASGLGASALGWGKSAQWLGNKVLPDSALKRGFNNVMDTANDAFKGVVDFGTSGVLGYKNAVKPYGAAKYGGYLPKHQGDLGSSTVGGGMMMYDGSADYNSAYAIPPQYVDTGKGNAPGFAEGFGMDAENGYGYDNNGNPTNTQEPENLSPQLCKPGSDCWNKHNKQNQQQQQQPANKQQSGTNTAGAEAAGGKSSFNGMEYAQKGMIGLGAFRDYTQWKNDRKERDEFENELKRVGNTDFRLASNSPNPFGNYTLNVGPANNFQLGMTTPVQDVGTRTSKYGGQSYEEGGEYQVTEDELLQLMQNGAEIEFINK